MVENENLRRRLEDSERHFVDVENLRRRLEDSERHLADVGKSADVSLDDSDQSSNEFRQKNEILRRRLEDSERYSRRDNLVFYGLKCNSYAESASGSGLLRDQACSRTVDLTCCRIPACQPSSLWWPSATMFRRSTSPPLTSLPLTGCPSANDVQGQVNPVLRTRRHR